MIRPISTYLRVPYEVQPELSSRRWPTGVLPSPVQCVAAYCYDTSRPQIFTKTEAALSRAASGFVYIEHEPVRTNSSTLLRPRPGADSECRVSDTVPCSFFALADAGIRQCCGGESDCMVCILGVRKFLNPLVAFNATSEVCGCFLSNSCCCQCQSTHQIRNGPRVSI